ncbi:MAG: IS3 family transposase [Sporolactobacillus sp.]|nr:IS3 family transposase [Sporolactobacillus sp.]
MNDLLEEGQHWINEGFSVKQTMQAMAVPRSLYYYHRRPSAERSTARRLGRPIPGYSRNQSGERITDEQIKAFLMEAIEGEETVYGYQKLTNYLRVEKRLVINPKKVYRLCHELNILLPQRKKRTRHPRKLAKQHRITGSNQFWEVDIKYGTIADSGRFFFVASAIDVFDRSIVGYYRGSHCQAADITAMLQQALRQRQVLPASNQESVRLIIRSDNGPQFVSDRFETFCAQAQLDHERIPNKSPNYNAHIESFHSVLERECFQMHDFEFFEEAYYWIDRYVTFYNQRRYHGSLNYRSPQEFYQQFRHREVQAYAVSL